MGARYYPGDKARFLSQDPVYLLVGASNFSKKWNSNWRDVKSDPSDSNQNVNANKDKPSLEENVAQFEYLSNPQNFNSYSYVLNNPLKYTDPTGENRALISALIGAGGGVLTQYLSDVIQNFDSGKHGSDAFGVTSSAKEYSVRGAQGAVIGLAGSTGSPTLTGSAAFITSIGADIALGNTPNLTEASVNSVITAITIGVINQFPQVPGRLPGSLFSPSFWTGKHTQHEAIKEAIQTGVQVIKEAGTAVIQGIQELKKGTN